MNPSTRLRLAKEARALLPMWAAVAVWITAPFLLPVNDPLSYAFTGFLFGCAVLGPVCVGHEFTHGTMGLLLSQPISRRRLWWEKLAVTGIALLTLSLLLVALVHITVGWGEVTRRAADDDPWLVALFLAVPVSVPLLGFCSGPRHTLAARNALGGAAATFIYPFFLLIFGLLMVASMGELTTRLEEQFLLSYVLLVGGIYSGGMFLFGCRRFERLEDVNTFAQEFAPPRQVSALFSGLTRHLAPAQHGPTLNLLRKELRLQQPAFLVAAFLVALWLTFIVVWKVHPPVGAEMLIVPSILIGLGIPVTVGIVSTAEERSLGVHEWHLTLPVSARRQWTVKVIVALGVNALLGLLLPGLLAYASSWLANNPQLVADIPGRNVSPLIIANLVLLIAALYASTASANGLRALIGTIVLFFVGGLVTPGGMQIGHWLGLLIREPSPTWLDASWGGFETYYWCIGWVCLAGWVWVMGFRNFRGAVESVRNHVPRIAGLYVAACVFVSLLWHWWFIKALWLQYLGG